MGSKKFFYGPFMGSKKSLYGPFMGSKKINYGPFMGSNKSIYSPFMGSDKSLYGPFMGSKKFLDGPFMGSNKSLYGLSMGSKKSLADPIKGLKNLLGSSLMCLKNLFHSPFMGSDQSLCSPFMRSNDASHSFLSFFHDLFLRMFINFHYMTSTLLYPHCCVSTTCKRLNILLRRNMYRKTDFVFYMQKLQPSLLPCSIQFILVKFLLYDMWAFEHLTNLLLTYQAGYTHPENKLKPSICTDSRCIVGGGSNTFSFEELSPYFIKNILYTTALFKFEGYTLKSTNAESDYICAIPAHYLLPKLTISELKIVAAAHGIFTHSKMLSAEIQTAIKDHMCENCQEYVSIFKTVNNNKCAQKSRTANLTAVKKYQEKLGSEYKMANLESAKKYQKGQGIEYKKANLESVKKYQNKLAFPPHPQTLELHTVISDTCEDMTSSRLTESGCAVCGNITPIMKLTNLFEANLNLDILIVSGVTQKERFFSNDPIQDLPGPILVPELENICKSCHKSLSKGKLPICALANGKWLGQIPEALKNLSFAEKLLIQ